MNDKEFIQNKKIALKKLELAKKENLVDEGIIPILDLLNQSNDYFTSSSCCGRTLVLEIPLIGDKKNAKFLGKWHRKIDESEIADSIKNSKKGQLWLLSQSPIIHITARSQDAADKLVKTAVACGFKNSNFKSIDKKIMIEICSTERLDSPIGLNGELFCIDKHLKLLVKISNDIINKSKIKLDKLDKVLRKDLSTYKTTNS
jgi:tRNA wybutosine-synthesizing protein 3